MSHLPYNGNLQEAINARDREAIREIMSWNNEHRGHIEQEKGEIHERALLCKNSEDYVSQETWNVNYLPEIYIRYMDSNEVIGQPLCYRKDDLLLLSNNPEHAWIITDSNPNLYFDDDGKVKSYINVDYEGYGEPSRIEKFVRIPPAYYIEYNSLLKRLEENTESLLAIPIYNTRVGNAEGSYGESRSHGQAPDVTVYYIVDYHRFQESPLSMYNYIYTQIYKLKTNIEIQSPLDMIERLQKDFRVAKEDRDYYLQHTTSDDEEFSDQELSEELLEEELLEEEELLVYTEKLPRISTDYLSADDIIFVMNDWVINPPEEQLKLCKLYEGIYRKYEFYDEILTWEDGDFFNTATFIYRNATPMNNYLVIQNTKEVYDIIWKMSFTYFVSPRHNGLLFDKPIYSEIEYFLNGQSQFVLGSILLILDNIFHNENLALWVNKSSPLELGPKDRSFGPYIIPETIQTIYNIIIGSSFEAPKLNTDDYIIIEHWDQWPDHLSTLDVINFILSHPYIRNHFFSRYYLDSIIKDIKININDIYYMFYLVFRAGFVLNIDESIQFVAVGHGNIYNMHDLISNYSDSKILLLFAKQPELQRIISPLKNIHGLPHISDYIGRRLDIIETNSHVVYRDRFHYIGTVGLDEPHQDVDVNMNDLEMMFYMDPAFHALIGPLPLSDSDYHEIRQIIKNL